MKFNSTSTENPGLLSVMPSGLVHVWGEEYWPRDVNQPETDEEV
jgi:hypothetical protein